MPAITNINDLQNISLDLAGTYWLTNDIDASGVNFVPLGTFTGTLNGRRHKIIDFTITLNGGGTQSAYLFSRNDGTIKNLGFEDCALNVVSTDGEAKACCITSDNRGFVLDCWSTGSISVTAGGTSTGLAAGLVLLNNRLGGVIARCNSTVTITVSSNGYAWAGGLVGRNHGNIDESYAAGNITANSSSATKYVHVGGFVAENGYDAAGYEGIINNSYARGNATASGGSVAYAGGFVAIQDHASSEIANSYSTGIPTADDTDGGFCAVNTAGGITDCFWDTQTSGTAVSDGGTGKTTSQMKKKSTFVNAGWDFIIIWAINGITNNGYPFFWTSPPEPPPNAPRRIVAVQDKITLESVRNVEMAARGRFYIDKEGKAVYKSRYGRNPSP